MKRDNSLLALKLVQQLSSCTTWMKLKLISFSVDHLIHHEKSKISSHHKKKLFTFIQLKITANGIQDNPNETTLNLTGRPLSIDQINVLKLGLRNGLATRPSHFEIMSMAEDVWDQVSRLDMFKEGCYIKDKVKNSLFSFTYNYIDLDLKEFNLGHKKIRILNDLSINFSILKCNKGTGIVLTRCYDYITSVKSLFTDSNKFKKIVCDPTPTRLSTLLKHGKITDTEYNFLSPKAVHFG